MAVMTKALYEDQANRLDRICKVTRKGRTGSDYVDQYRFPIQNNDLIGTEVMVKYRNLAPAVHHDNGDRDIFYRRCIVLRFDTTEPYTFIGWIKGTPTVVVGDSRTYDTDVMTKEGQRSNIPLLDTKDFYRSDDIEGIRGTIIRADGSPPDITVIAERIDEEQHIIRFVLADETTALLKNYIPEPESEPIPSSFIVDTIKELLANNEIYKSNIEEGE